MPALCVPAALLPAAPSRGWSLSGTSVPLRGDPTRFVDAFVTCGGPTHSQGTEASGVPAAVVVAVVPSSSSRRRPLAHRHLPDRVVGPLPAPRSPALSVPPRFLGPLQGGRTIQTAARYDLRGTEVPRWGQAQVVASDVVYAAPDAFVTSTDQVIALSSQEGWGLRALATASLR
mgnify:CR=1 FL=1